MKYSFCFVPVELGLEFLLTARINWLENELKVKTKPVIVKELKFDGVPENVLQLMNEKKLTLMDFVMMKMEMILEGKELFVLATEEVLGSSKTLLGTLEKVVESFTDFPVSLKTFSSAVLIGDITQRDTRKNKSSYQLRSTSVEDEVVLIWVNIDDLKLVTQKKKDLELVEMAKAVKLDDVVAAEGDEKVDQDCGDDDLGDEGTDSFKDSEGPSEQQ